MGLARMQGKSVVISGAAFGIGRATAAKFAEEGASLLVQDIQERPLLAFRDELQRNGATVEALVGDVSKVEDCQAMIRAAVETYGRVDVVVANAGIIPLGDVLESTVDDWNKVMSIDGRGMFLTCKYAIEAMLKTGGGSIVCLSSISGLQGRIGKRHMAQPNSSQQVSQSTWPSSGRTGAFESTRSLPGRSIPRG
jgi:NAD(P)-dependent dehydrogenase (short-subunit alcohol dehydrogenase family)